jgi:fructosamine-3-kinase
MWQAISHLLSEQLGEGEIELRNELPGGEIHAAWHLRYAGRDLFVKCDERELLPSLPPKPTSWSCCRAVKR